jgi:hypothetical protein
LQQNNLKKNIGNFFYKPFWKDFKITSVLWE